MDPRQCRQAQTRPVWLSPYLLAVALFPAFLQTDYSCERGDAYLSTLEVEVAGYNQIVDFRQDERYYDVAISADSVLVQTETRDPTSSATYQLYVDEASIDGGALGTGAGEVSLGIPLGLSTLRISVRATEGRLRHYDIDISRLPEFACTEQGILDAIAFGGGPHYFDCNVPTTVTTQAEIVIDNDVILDGEGNLIVDGAGALPHRVFSVSAAVASQLIGMTVTGGDAGQAEGGGIDNAGALVLLNSTVGSNQAERGGGVHNTGQLFLTNSTVSGNSADVEGGGIYDAGTLTLAHSTVSTNSAPLGGGISALQSLASNVANSLVDGACSGVITSTGHNIESPGDTCGFDQASDQVSVSAANLNLAPLADHGGPTQTHALLPGSVAIDAVPEASCIDADGAPLSEDQRGVGRPQDSDCDVGAFEYADCTGSPCDDANQCTADYCDPADYSWCAHTDLPDGASCDFSGSAGECRSGLCVPLNICPNLNVINAIPSTIRPGNNSTLVQTRGQETDGVPMPLLLTLSALWGTFENTENIQMPGNVVGQNATYICDRPGPVEICVDATDGACTKTLCTDVSCPTE